MLLLQLVYEYTNKRGETWRSTWECSKVECALVSAPRPPPQVPLIYHPIHRYKRSE